MAASMRVLGRAPAEGQRSLHRGLHLVRLVAPIGQQACVASKGRICTWSRPGWTSAAKAPERGDGAARSRRWTGWCRTGRRPRTVAAPPAGDRWHRARRSPGIAVPAVAPGPKVIGSCAPWCRGEHDRRTPTKGVASEGDLDAVLACRDRSAGTRPHPHRVRPVPRRVVPVPWSGRQQHLPHIRTSSGHRRWRRKRPAPGWRPAAAVPIRR